MSDPPVVPASVPAAPGVVTVDEFKKIQLKIATVLSAELHPQADRLLLLKLDVGGGETRQVVAGIRGSYEPSSLIGKQVVVVANLKPATIRGVESQGMVLAASTETSLTLVTTDRPAQVGSLVK
ncbi:MAG TPA: methionine--tRNA ligase subunit beta [Candidatus Omnitrophica bacterium]|nr:MAG: methionine--tRNA ligase subunit beta [Omnitrophica WOR_2 bacterium GWA2_63_20]OGX32344.1 MAG: methionine--tRNA ligase subunit beta [Omnitrophica WOR_2 bacterium RIFCSPHIGHO2_12_FULL_64_13]OGX35249.1 MAG: methionine--tRNA ligase subunit beta [Omnitrophica WOR_2 bacterium RIFCSPHIGHO2_02_FULL_63_39]OGX45092.1 MAG: methionine--tRNA ligase subunit beta [Omnitrophica WOR_2 bacterium RIFCSPLOWO2_02_FULL_63_16]OGX48977.1 MAG: methionine--tRNA ligase subunit beta [Omnitrophica WOR_2 bacterium R